MSFEPKAVFSGFSVNDFDEAKQFYGETLGFDLQQQMGGARLKLPNGAEAWMYHKADHQPASYTMLNFMVDDINAAVDDLVERGIKFEHYDSGWQDERGIARGKSQNHGPDIAWFKDPAGNILAVLEV
jgi:catechol 2,3-dioxygenase-like lactoylglutathione lyase family enzyme